MQLAPRTNLRSLKLADHPQSRFPENQARAPHVFARQIAPWLLTCPPPSLAYVDCCLPPNGGPGAEVKRALWCVRRPNNYPHGGPSQPSAHFDNPGIGMGTHPGMKFYVEECGLQGWAWLNQYDHDQDLIDLSM